MFCSLGGAGPPSLNNIWQRLISFANRTPSVVILQDMAIIVGFYILIQNTIISKKTNR